MNITNKYGPNTTILLPGSCNADCSFCFWNKSWADIDVPDDYIQKVENVLNRLPSDFSVLSVSGGEPTLSPWFGKVMGMLSKLRRHRHFDRLVLTTHGGNLLPHITAIGCVFEHINISRHAIGTEANQEIFKTKKIPTDDELKKIIKRIHSETSCDVTLNCVIPPDVSTSFCEEFIKYARDVLGADAVSFRKVASDATATDAEHAFAAVHGVTSETKCPVCRGMEQNVNGYTVRWKGSVNEPSIDTGGVYEAIIHPDGNAYTDWGMTVPLFSTVTPSINQEARAEAEEIINQIKQRRVISGVTQKVIVEPYTSGCGGGGGCGYGFSSYSSGCGGGCGR
jgi:MoaA/NifB/PqqE/SkfB family radical SAM enzyme